jgi:hypothetical protein
MTSRKERKEETREWGKIHNKKHVNSYYSQNHSRGQMNCSSIPDRHGVY